MAYLGTVPAPQPLTNNDLGNAIVDNRVIANGAVTVNKIFANGTANNTTVLSGAGNWINISNVAAVGPANSIQFQNTSGNGLEGSANLQYNDSTTTLTLIGTVAVVDSVTGNTTFSVAGANGNIQTLGILTDNYYYANGQPLDVDQPQGPNLSLQFSFNNNFAGTSNLTFDPTTNQLVLSNGTANINSLNVTNIFSGNIFTATGNITGANLISNAFVQGVSVVATSNVLAGNLNTTGAITGANLTTAGFAVIGGNAIVQGNLQAPNAIVDNAYISTSAVIAGAVITGNSITANTGTFAGNVVVGNLISAGNISGNISGNFIVPGANTQLLFNDDGIANASAGFTFDKATNVAVLASTLTAGNLQTAGAVTAKGANTQVQYNNNGNLAGSAQFTFNAATNTLAVPTANVTGVNATGNVAAGNILTSAIESTTDLFVLANGIVDIRANSNVVVKSDNGAYTWLFDDAGRLTAPGNITGSNIIGAAATFTGNVTANNISVSNTATIGGVITGNIDAANVNVTANILATGNIAGNYFLGNGAFLTGVTAYTNANVANYLVTYNGNASFGNITVVNNLAGNTATFADVAANTVTANTASISGNVAAGNIAATGDISGATANITGNVSTGNIAAAGNVNAQLFIGEGLLGNTTFTTTTFFSNAAATFGTGNSNVKVYGSNGTVQATAIVANTITGNITGNIAAAGANLNIQYNRAGILAGSGAFVVDDVANTVTVAGTITGGNLQTAGNVTAAGSNTQVQFNNTGNLAAHPGLVYLPASSTLQPGNLDVPGTAVVQQLSVTANGFVAGQLLVNSNITSLVGNISAATGYVLGNGRFLTGLPAQYSNANVANYLAVYDGNALFGNIVVSNDAVITGNLRVDGNTTFINANTLVIGDKNIVLAANAATATDANGAGIQVGNTTTYASIEWLSNGNIWDFSGNIAADWVFAQDIETIGNAYVLGNIEVTGNVTAKGSDTQVQYNNGGNLAGSSQFTFDAAANTLSVTTANVTGINAAGNIIAVGNVTGNYLLGNGAFLTGVTAYTNANVANYLVTYGGNILAGNISVTGNTAVTGNVSSDYFIGNGRFLSGIDTTLISNGTTEIRTLQDANITVQVAGFANVVVFDPGGATVGGNVTAANFIGNVIGNVTGNITAAGANTQVLFNDQGLTNAVAGFTFNKATNAVGVTGNITAGNIDVNIVDATTAEIQGRANVTTVGLVSGVSSRAVLRANAFSGADTVFQLPSTNGTANASLLTDGTGNTFWGAIIQGAAGSDRNIQFNDGGQFAGSNNFAWTTSNELLVTGNILANGGGYISANGSTVFANLVSSNVAVVTGNVTAGNVDASTGTVAANTIILGGLITGTGAGPAPSLTNFELVNSANANITNTLRVGAANVYSNGAIITTGNITTTANAAVGNLLTDNLYYANGTRWDLQDPAGANTQVQFNDGNSNFGASSAFTFDRASNVLSVSGNANVNYYLGNGSALTGVFTTVATRNSGDVKVILNV